MPVMGGWEICIDDISIEGATAPVSAFSGSPVSGTVPFNVVFTDISTNTPTSWAWDFGDGTTSTEQNPTHTYKNPGLYDVSLIATNVGGSDTETKTDYINAGFGSPSFSTYNGRKGLGINTDGGVIPWGV